MPRVFRKTKNRGGHHVYHCDKCGKEIEAGQDYLTWKFNRGSRFLRHAECGMPRRSELTNSKMGPVYDAVDGFDPEGMMPDDIKGELESIAAVAREVGEEYTESADNIEGAWPSGNPTSEACRATGEALETWAGALESWEPDGDEPEGDDEKEQWLDTQREAAQEVVNEQPEYEG